jgi:hypothetical protein
MKRFLLLIPLLFVASCSTTPPPSLSSLSTAELHLERSQLSTELGNGKFRYATTSDPNAQLGVGWRLRSLTEKKNAVERELLRRYQAGDESAYLPSFGLKQPH